MTNYITSAGQGITNPSLMTKWHNDRLKFVEWRKRQEVFSRPECLFHYCPHPRACQVECHNVAPSRS